MQTTYTEEKRNDPLSQPQLDSSDTNPFVPGDVISAWRWMSDLLYQGESVTQKRVSPDFWNLDSVESFLPEPTFLLSFLPLSFSISSTLHLFPTHDDTFLLTYPIQLFLLPIITTMPSPRQQFVVYNPIQQQHVVYNPIQQQPMVYSPS